MESYVVEFSNVLETEINNLNSELRDLKRSGNIYQIIAKYEEMWVLIRQHEKKLIAGKRYHKGGYFYDFGRYLLGRRRLIYKERGERELCLAYIEDLLDYETIEEAQSCPAFLRLVSGKYYSNEFLLSIKDESISAKNRSDVPQRPGIIYNKVVNGSISEVIEKHTPEKVVNGSISEVIDEHTPDTVAISIKKRLLEAKKEKAMKKATRLFFIFTGILLVVLWNKYLNSNPIYVALTEFNILLVINGYIWSYFVFTNPYPREDKAFLKLVDAIDNFDNVYKNDELTMELAEKIVDIANTFKTSNALGTSSTSWHRDSHKIFLDFINNLKTRVVPGIKEKKVTHSHLLKIANVFLDSSIIQLIEMNEYLENQFKEPVESPSSKIPVSIKNIYNENIIKFLSPFIFSFIIIFIVGYGSALYFEIEPKTFFYDYFGHFLGSWVALSVAPNIISYLTRRESDHGPAG